MSRLDEIEAALQIEAIEAQLARLAALRAMKQAEREAEAQEARKYLYDPVGWITRYILGHGDGGLTPYQAEILEALARERRAAARGPHGLGKSMMASCTVLWFANTREAAGIDWKVLTTASAWRHLTKYLWPEVHKWARHLAWEDLGRKPYSDRDELLDLSLKLRLGAASAVASSKPEYIEGAHADSLLYVIDEAKIVPDESWDAIEGAFSGGRTDGTLPEAFALAISTPGPPRGRFFEIHTRKPGLEDWWVRHVKLEEAIAAGRISREWADQRRRQWGEDSALYANRVLGEFHEGDEDTLIPLSWIEAAIDRWRAWDDAGRPPLEGKRFVGADIARSGGDETVFAHRTGMAITGLEHHRREDTMQTAARLSPLIRREKDADGEPKCYAVVDTIGVGAGVYDRLRELRLPALAYTGSAKTNFRDKSGEYGFENTRSGAYWNMRELLDPAYDTGIMLPPNDLMVSDLNTPTWTIASGVPPKIKVEKKDDVAAKLGRSPDDGDAVVMAFWAEQLRREAQVAVPKGQLPVRGLSPLPGGRGAGGRSGMGPLG